MGTCQYLLTGTNANSSMPGFDVRVQHRHAWGPRNTEVAMAEHVWLRFTSQDGKTDYNVYLRIGDPTKNGGRPSFVVSEVTTSSMSNMTTVEETFVVTNMKNADFELVNHRRFVIVKTWSGVNLEYGAHNWAIDVRVPECYKNELEGLCGNYNGNRNDDFTTKAGLITRSVVDFGQSWLTANSGDDCQAGAATFEECKDASVISTCGVIGSDSSVFKSCSASSRIEHETFRDNCIFDHCIDKDVKCGILGNYAQACMAELAGDLKSDDAICTWADSLGCAPKCPENSVFSACASLCDIKTCANPNGGNNCPANGRFTSMCVCKDGFVMENGSCIPQNQCGCKLNNGAQVALGSVIETCQQRCECKKTNTTPDFVCGKSTLAASVCEPKCSVDGKIVDHGHVFEDCEKKCECNKGSYKCGPSTKPVSECPTKPVAKYCPDTHPYPYFGGDYCCKTNKEKNDPSANGALCDGSVLGIDSRCCEGDQAAKCPNPPCQPSSLFSFISSLKKLTS